MPSRPRTRAFEAVGLDTLQSLLRPANKDQLTSGPHPPLVEGELKAADLRDGQTLETTQGERLRVRISGDTVRVGDARVLQPDVDASNGVARHRHGAQPAS